MKELWGKGDKNTYGERERDNMGSIITKRKRKGVKLFVVTYLWWKRITERLGEKNLTPWNILFILYVKWLEELVRNN